MSRARQVSPEAPVVGWESAPLQGINARIPRAVTARDPARSISFVSCAGYYRSSKMGAEFPFESLSERDAMVLLDIDPGVLRFHAQPETFRWMQAGRRRRYTPDILVEFTGGDREYREVKTKKMKDQDPTLCGRLDRILIECAMRTATFSFWTREEIQRQPRLCNARRLRSSLDFLDSEAVQTVGAAIAVEGLPSTLGALAQRLGGGIKSDATILALAACGELAIDITAPLNAATPVKRGHVPWGGVLGRSRRA